MTSSNKNSSRSSTTPTAPTLPNWGLLGHSLGGLFAIYALEQRPALFQRIVAASPALTWDNGRMLTEARRALAEHRRPVRLDLSVGSADELGFAKPTTTFARILGQAKPAGLDYRFTVYQGENHNSVRMLSFPAGLYWVYDQPKIRRSLQLEVVASPRMASISLEPPIPVVSTPFAQQYGTQMTLLVRTTSDPAAMAAVAGKSARSIQICPCSTCARSTSFYEFGAYHSPMHDLPGSAYY